MDFLMDPLEPVMGGIDTNPLMSDKGHICDMGFMCLSGTVNPLTGSSDEDDLFI